MAIANASSIHVDPAVCVALLGFGASVDAGDQNGNTALRYAALNGHADACAVLLDFGASSHQDDEELLALLHQAAEDGQTEVRVVLLKPPWDIERKYAHGHTALQLAALGGHSELCV